MTNPEDSFVDYYELMQVSPNAEAEMLNRVFRLFAARYHPDNPKTGDTEKFLLFKTAHRTLSSHEDRAAYDARRENHRRKAAGASMGDLAAGIPGEAVHRLGLLCLLYHRRRATPESPGVSLLFLEKEMALPREEILFALWYLLEKSQIRRDERSDYFITAEGVDFVETRLSLQPQSSANES